MKLSKITATLTVIGVLALGLALYIWLPVSIFKEPPGSNITQHTPTGIQVETVAEGLSAPWSIDFTSDGDIFFTERPGRVRLIKSGELLTRPLLSLPEAAAEGGTLGIALDPNFDTTQYVFIYYTHNGTNRISRFRFDGELLTEETKIVEDIPGAAIHNGGRIAFGPDGMLYAGTGDANVPDLSQDLNSLAGKVLRINPDGSVPLDNPFPDSFIYSLGHRNVQGLDWDSEGNLYATEHGARAKDEINLIEPGANYGWPIVEGNIDLGPTADAPVADYRNPVIESGNVTWAPSGAAFYTDEVLPRSWHGSYVFAGLRSQSLWRYNPESDRLDRVFNNDYGRLRDVKQSPEGYLYFLTSNRDGRGNPGANDDRILRIVPN